MSDQTADTSSTSAAEVASVQISPKLQAQLMRHALRVKAKAAGVPIVTRRYTATKATGHTRRQDAAKARAAYLASKTEATTS